MSLNKRAKDAITLHHEMYERRCREKAWFRGHSLREVIQRINTMRSEEKHPREYPNDGQGKLKLG